MSGILEAWHTCRSKSVLFATLFALFVASCGHSDDSRRNGPIKDFYEGIVGTVWGTDRPSTGTGPVMIGDQIDKVDLITLLDPENRRKKMCPKPKDFGSDQGTPNENKLDAATEAECAFNAFYTYLDQCPNKNSCGKSCYTEEDTCNCKASDKDCECESNNKKCECKSEIAENKDCECKLDYKKCATERFSFSGQNADRAAKNLALIIRRNQVQDKILAVSENACSRFKIGLNDQLSKSNFTFGTTVTTLAGLAAIFTDATTSRSLAGAASIISGTRAEYNEAYLRGLAVHVITKGIDAKRQGLLDDINGRRYGPPFLANQGEIELLDGSDANITCATVRGRKVCTRSNGKDGLIYGQRAVRYASRPYIPLSPLDKVKLTLQEEFLQEIVKKQRKLKSIDKKIENRSTQITQTKTEIQEREDDKRERDEKRRDELQAEIDGYVSEIATLKERIKGIESGPQKDDPTFSAQAEKLKGDISVLEGMKAKAQAALNRISVPSRIDCSDQADSKLQQCVKLKENFKALEKRCETEKTKTRSSKKTSATDDPSGTKNPSAGQKKSAECEALKKLKAKDPDFNSCLKTVNISKQAIATCKDAGLRAGLGEQPIREGSREDTLPSERDAERRRKQNLEKLESEKKGLVQQRKSLKDEIEEFEDKFGSDVSTVDAIVGMVPLSQYTVEMAVRDAIQFHAACSIPAGLEKAADSVEKIRSPGFDTVRQGLDNMIDIQRRVNDLETLRQDAERKRREFDRED